MERSFVRGWLYRPAGWKSKILMLLAAACAVPGPARGQGWMGGGPEIGWIRDLLEAQDGVLYAATYGGGIFRSNNGGRDWVEATSNARDAVVIDLDQSPEFPSYLYAAAEDRAFLRRAQGSDFWAELAGFPIGESPAGLSLETFPTRPSRVAFGSVFGVYVSNSYGADWPDTLSYAAGQTVNDLLVLPDLPNTIHAVTPFELLVTSDTGRSVQFYSEGLNPGTYLFDVEPWSSGIDSLLFADLKGPLWQFVERQRFESVGPAETPPLSKKYFVRIDPADPDRVLMGSSSGLWRTEDRLVSWDRLDGGVEAVAAEIWTVEPSRVSVTDSLRLGSFTLGFLRTGPGGDGPWEVSNAGLTAAWARSIHPLSSGRALCGTAHGRLFQSTDGGASWQDVTGSLRTLQIAVAHDTGSSWIVSGSDGVFRSTDGGLGWSEVVLPAPVTRLNRIVQVGSTLVAATNVGAARSDDDGRSFVRVPGVAVERASFAIAVDPDGNLAIGLDRAGPNPPWIAVGRLDTGFAELALPTGYQGGVRGIAFAGTDLIVGSDAFGGAPLYRVSDWAGATPGFSDLSALVGDGLFDVRDLAARGNVIAAGTTTKGVFLSEDSGLSWREWNEDLPSLRIESIAFEPAPSREVWVATLGRGVHSRTLDPGVPVVVAGFRATPAEGSVRVALQVHASTRVRVWRRSAGLGDRLLFEGDRANELELTDVLPEGADPGTAVAYAAEAWSKGTWIEMARIERTVRELVIPARSRLFAAAPNPFNPRTELRFELAEAGRVRLEIFDARGRLVRRLIDRELSVGPHTTTFDGRDDSGSTLASGVYFVRIRAPETTLTGRVTLIR